MFARHTLRRLARLLMAGATLLAGAAGTARAQDIKIAWQPDPNVPLYIAREKKMFEAEGLKPDYVKFLAAPPMFAALQSASVDVADMGLAPAIIGKSQGIDIKIVAIALDVSATNVLVAGKGVKISSPNDLKGKRVGAQRGTTPYFGLVRYLESSGLGIKDIKFVDLTAPNIVPAFRQGELDAAWVWSPWQNMLVAMGGTPVTSNKAVGALAPQVWAVRTQWARENPRTLQKFLKVLDASFQQISANQALAVKQLTATLNIEEAVSLQVLKANEYPPLKQQAAADYRLSIISGHADAKAGVSRAVKQAADFLHSQGIIKTNVAPADLVDPEPLRLYLK
jgi:aliphatic sulfonates family ABC transporter substrate-binding protein